MKVVLLERVDNLGAIGDVVTVKDGFARNFLLPRDKARRATAANLKAFELDRAAIEQRNEKNKADAQKVADKIDGQTYVMIRQAGETGQLYGSVAGRDVAEAELSVTAVFDDVDEWWGVHTLGVGSTAHTLDGLDDAAIGRIRAAARDRFGGGPVEITGTAWAARGLAA